MFTRKTENWIARNVKFLCWCPRSLTASTRMDKLAYMTPPYESEIRTQIVSVLGGALGQTPEAARIRLPAKLAHASFRPPIGADLNALAALDFGALYGAPLVSSVRVVNGWLLFDFSPAFFSALVDEINRSLPAPDTTDETHAQNRMRVLARHEGTGCPDFPAFHRALVLSLVAHESPAAYRKAEHAAKTLFHTFAPRERAALFSHCGALGGALWRLLTLAH